MKQEENHQRNSSREFYGSEEHAGLDGRAHQVNNSDLQWTKTDPHTKQSQWETSEL